MHFATILSSIAAFSTAVVAAPTEKPYVGVAIMTYNGDDSLPMNVPLGVLTHDKRKVTEIEIARVYSTVDGVKAPKTDQVTCQMYKDQYGTVPASKDFTAKKGAVISTKGVDFGWLLCRVNASK
ncbi:uncharacterized protein B0J16DRAFT_336433 [Fusarium flagelliforme]|uniref:Uncharacterized protein n=1 Tax=Fusarium flagelliforme TaxID=2675880 RepID=A0A395N3L0_9HYPO|nr:uncharacterized protein B0J16DRAFT_336433 [Fusarium flagelliforme]KAH7188079.1 hypothetical protein B0J16DRAFT_336433 [Fusarium flagelliforme]RFN54520.1 hypothetical protein FIE12Z_1175 [Fusarium flagelliforme]